MIKKIEDRRFSLVEVKHEDSIRKYVFTVPDNIVEEDVNKFVDYMAMRFGYKYDGLHIEILKDVALYATADVVGEKVTGVNFVKEDKEYVKPKHAKKETKGTKFGETGIVSHKPETSDD